MGAPRDAGTPEVAEDSEGSEGAERSEAVPSRARPSGVRPSDARPSQAWHPAPGETLLARIPVSFATGAATPVSGMRWFRDDERRDVQAELAGWPEGPVYFARSTASRLARNGLKVGLTAALITVVGALGGTGVGDVSTLGRSGDPADEVEDFPVLWAAPGTLARALPWQLDPARRPDTDRTHAIITDRRLVVVGLLDDERPSGTTSCGKPRAPPSTAWNPVISAPAAGATSRSSSRMVRGAG